MNATPPARELRHERPIPRRPYRVDIEGLRGVAVLLVVLYHVGIPGAGGGFIGVDVFFVLSGYLITQLLTDELRATGRVDFREFYARRARRLLPASSLVVLATVAAGALVYSPLEQERLAGMALATTVYVSNFWLIAQAADYFAATADGNPLLHTWSLGVEEQFYLLWPLLLLGAFLAVRRTRVMLVAGIAAALSFGACVWLTDWWHPLAFFSSPTRAWEFALGGMASLGAVERLVSRREVSLALGWSGLAAVLLAAALFHDSMGFPGAAALLPVLGTVGVLAGAGRSAHGAGRLLGTPPLPFIGKLSYSWYLWHWPAIVFASVLYPALGGYARLGAAAVGLGLAFGTYHLLENPLRRHRHLTFRPTLSLSIAAGLTLIAGATALAVWSRAQAAARRPDQIAYTRASLDRPAMYARGCLAPVRSAAGGECTFGTGERTIVLLGDSHAAQWWPALEIVARERGLRLVTLTRSSCPWVAVTPYNLSLRREYHECTEAREAAIDRIGQLDPAAVVVANASDYFPPGVGRRRGYPPEQWRAAARTTLEKLDSLGAPVFVLLDTPRMDRPVPTCLARAAGRSGTDACDTDRASAVDEHRRTAERAAAAGLRDVTVIDPIPYFCGPRTCAAVRDGMVVYQDEAHITASYAAHLAPVLEAALQPAISRGTAAEGS